MIFSARPNFFRGRVLSLCSNSQLKVTLHLQGNLAILGTPTKRTGPDCRPERVQARGRKVSGVAWRISTRVIICFVSQTAVDSDIASNPVITTGSRIQIFLDLFHVSCCAFSSGVVEVNAADSDGDAPYPMLQALVRQTSAGFASAQHGEFTRFILLGASRLVQVHQSSSWETCAVTEVDV